MQSPVPVYELQSFPEHQPDSLFYMTRLEQLMQDVKGIDKPHSHTFYLVMWISQGSGTHTIDFKTYPIEPNQLYFLTPGQVHSWVLSADIRGFNLFFEANFFRNRYGNRLHQYLFYHSHQYQPLVQVSQQADLFSDVFTHAYNEYRQQQANRAEVFLSFVHILLESADRLYSHQQTDADLYLFDRIRQYEDLLEEQFLRVRDVSTYAGQMGLSPNYLNHICKKVLHKTASQLIHERLIVEAKRLLAHSAQSVKEIGFQLQFEDPSYFVRFFKKYTGITPVKFRRQLSHNR